MRRVVVTGMGIVSSIGNNLQDVADALREGRSGIEYSEEYEKHGFPSRVHGSIDVDLASAIDRKQKRFMGDAAAYNYVAMVEAIQDSGVSQEMITSPRTGLVVGSGGGSPENIANAIDPLREKGVKRWDLTWSPGPWPAALRPVWVQHSRSRGVSYSISSACATSAHCIGNAAELIQMGKQDLVFAGGGEELHWTTTVLFDAMGGLSSKYNDTPQTASRTYDADRDGFVISGAVACW
ncbi:MAG: hypothetical protein CM1200mP20_16900 [Pseudomonadota bacterium]|nr:MAG: hypothetical protein CM1200mP20_16900 [Pseudomonadota bacterium]